jgi:hypothetical protein
MLYVDTMQMIRIYLWIVAGIETLALILTVYLRVKYEGKITLVVFAVIGCAVAYVFLVLSYFVRIRGIG